jgi:hypothetical protein
MRPISRPWKPNSNAAPSYERARDKHNAFLHKLGLPLLP